MTRCSYTGCSRLVSQYSQIGLCIVHDQEAWAFLRTPPDERQWRNPCSVCGVGPRNGGRRMCMGCYNRRRKKLQQKEKING